MKKIVSWMFITFIVSFMLIGCGSETIETESDSVTIKDGVLMVGTQMEYAPMEFRDEGGNPEGFDMEMAKALADEMGLELELVDTAWDAIFVGVEDGNYDAIISSVSYTKQREEEHTLTKTYMDNGLVLVVAKDSDIHSLEDLEGKQVAVQLGSTADYAMSEQLDKGIHFDLGQYEKVIYAYKELLNGNVDAVCSDQVVSNYYLGEKASDYKTIWKSQNKEPLCICLAKGNDSLKEQIEQAMVSLQEKGVLRDLSMKYFGEDLTSSLEK